MISTIVVIWASSWIKVFFSWTSIAFMCVAGFFWALFRRSHRFIFLSVNIFSENMNILLRPFYLMLLNTLYFGGMRWLCLMKRPFLNSLKIHDCCFILAYVPACVYEEFFLTCLKYSHFCSLLISNWILWVQTHSFLFIFMRLMAFIS